MTIVNVSVPVGRASPKDLEAVTAALADAFTEDRIFRWIYPDPLTRPSSVRAFFEPVVEAFAPHGAVYRAGSGPGAALWLPPGRELVGAEQVEAFERRIMDSAAEPTEEERLAEVMTLLDEHHPSEPCWYLNFLGVVPALQGGGIGSALLREVLSIADRDGVPAYLEATSPDNRRLYERHGFRTVRELTVSDCPAIYPMWREPQA